MPIIIPPTSPYSFTAMTSLDIAIPLTFQPISQIDSDWLKSVWKDLANAVRKAHSLMGQNIPKWMNWQPWQWFFDKAILEKGRTPIIALAEEMPVGCISCWQSGTSPDVIYLEHIGAMPVDIPTLLWNRRYHGIGWSLFAFAILLSSTNGCDGRVGLHPETDVIRAKVYGDYEKEVPDLFKPDQKGIAGPTPYGEKKNLSSTYLETTESGAMKFLEGFRGV